MTGHVTVHRFVLSELATSEREYVDKLMYCIEVCMYVHSEVLLMSHDCHMTLALLRVWECRGRT